MTSVDLDVAQLRFVDLASYRMAYREWGNSTATQAIVLLHGITSSSLSWVRVAPRLAAHARVIAVDMKGHGDSDKPATGYRLADQADEVAGLCAALNLGQVTMVGHSWGGGAALLLGATGALPIRRLVLEDPAVGQRHLTPEQAAQWRRSREMYGGSVGLSQAEAEARAKPNLSLGWTDADVAGKVDAAMKGSRPSVEAVFDENGPWNLVDKFKELRCPTLMVRADVAKGGIVGAEAVAAARANPLVRVVTIPDADHNIHRGRFDAFMGEVEPFLASSDS